MDHEHCSSLPRSRSHRAHKRAPGRELCRRRWALDVRRKHVVTEYPNLLSDSHPSKESPRIPLNSPPSGASRGAFSQAFVGPAWFASRGGTPEIAASVRQLEHAAVTARSAANTLDAWHVRLARRNIGNGLLQAFFVDRGYEAEPW